MEWHPAFEYTPSCHPERNGVESNPEGVCEAQDLRGGLYQKKTVGDAGPYKNEIFCCAKCEITYKYVMKYCVNAMWNKINSNTPQGVFHVAKPHFTHEVYFINSARNLFHCVIRSRLIGVWGAATCIIAGQPNDVCPWGQMMLISSMMFTSWMMLRLMA